MENALSFTSDKWVWIAPLGMIVIDIILGLAVAYKEKKLKSSTMRKGLAKKVGELSAIGVTALLSFSFGLPFNVVRFMSAYVVGIELLSVFENLDLLGVKLPTFVSSSVNNIVDNMKDEGKNDG